MKNNIIPTYSVLTLSKFRQLSDKERTSGNYKTDHCLNLNQPNFRSQHVASIRKELTGNVEASDVRLVGTYETYEEAKFISGKINKQVRHDNQKIYAACAQSDDDPTELLEDTTTAIKQSDLKPTPVKTNGVSNVTHHLNNLEDMRNNRFESTIITLSGKAESGFTFMDFIKKQEKAA